MEQRTKVHRTKTPGVAARVSLYMGSLCIEGLSPNAIYIASEDAKAIAHLILELTSSKKEENNG